MVCLGVLLGEYRPESYPYIYLPIRFIRMLISKLEYTTYRVLAGPGRVP